MKGCLRIAEGRAGSRTPSGFFGGLVGMKGASHAAGTSKTSTQVRRSEDEAAKTPKAKRSVVLGSSDGCRCTRASRCGSFDSGSGLKCYANRRLRLVWRKTTHPHLSRRLNNFGSSLAADV